MIFFSRVCGSLLGAYFLDARQLSSASLGILPECMAKPWKIVDEKDAKKDPKKRRGKKTRKKGAKKRCEKNTLQEREQAKIV